MTFTNICVATFCRIFVLGVIEYVLLRQLSLHVVTTVKELFCQSVYLKKDQTYHDHLLTFLNCLVN